jgi:hypothetical protein
MNPKLTAEHLGVNVRPLSSSLYLLKGAGY